jgi:hypothetical protein
MIGRLPLWATLLPLLVGVLVWAVLWRGQAARLEDDLQRALPGTDIAVTGFPYRLEAHISPVSRRHEDTALVTALKAAEVSVNRVPWQPGRQVLNLTDSTAAIALRPLAGVSATISAAEAQASLRLEEGRIARLSGVWESPRIETGLLPPATAGHFEAHLRETPSAKSAPSSPRLPTQAQLVLAAKELRLGQSDPLALAFDSELTAGAPLASLAGWATGGTAEIRAATLSDRTGDVARLTATLVAEAGALRLSGTVETVCPANVRAALAGLPPVSEKRLRKPERIALSGTLPGGIVAAPAVPGRPAGPVRGQEPPCPRLR